MEEIKFTEQDVINAICLHVAKKRQIDPSQVLVELLFDDDQGFSAEVHVSDRQQILIEANMIEAIRFYLESQLNRNPYSAAVRLELDDEEGIIAFAKYN